MTGKQKPAPTVHVALDAAAIKAAEERHGQLIEAELARHILQETAPMLDPAAQAALDAAKKDAADAKAETTKLRSDLDAATKAATEAAKAAQDAAKAVTDMKVVLDAQAKSAQDASATKLKDTAKAVALLRVGRDASKVTDAEVTRLSGLGQAALDDQLQLLQVPGLVAPSMALAPVAIDGQTGGAYARSERSGALTVTDWSKVPVGSHDPKKNPMGVRA